MVSHMPTKDCEILGDHLLDDDRDDEWILEAGMLEVLSAVVEDEVDKVIS